MAVFAFLGLSIYVWIALVSFVFLVAVALLGDFGIDTDADMDIDVDYGEFVGPGVSPLSPPLIATFGTTFGAVGALLEAQGLVPVAVAGLAAVVAVVVAAGLFFVVERFLVRSQASSDVRTSDLVGRDGSVLIPIRGGMQGQILVITEERGRTLLAAVSKEDIERDAAVEILGFSGGVANVRKKVG